MVKSEGIVPAPRVLNVPVLSRKVYSKAVVGEVARLNLFRKERKKYYRPKPPKPKPQIKPRPKPALPRVVVAPPPELILTGVILLSDQKVAVFEGTYSEIREGTLTRGLKPHRRGYKIGEFIAGYKITDINRIHATLVGFKDPLIFRGTGNWKSQEILRMG